MRLSADTPDDRNYVLIANKREDGALLPRVLLRLHGVTRHQRVDLYCLFLRKNEGGYYAILNRSSA